MNFAGNQVSPKVIVPDAFEKLSIVKISTRGEGQGLIQLGTLKITDKGSKLPYFDTKRGILLLVNKDVRPGQHIILHSIKLQQVLHSEGHHLNSDSEEDLMSPGAKHDDNYPISVKF